MKYLVSITKFTICSMSDFVGRKNICWRAAASSTMVAWATASSTANVLDFCRFVIKRTSLQRR